MKSSFFAGAESFQPLLCQDVSRKCIQFRCKHNTHIVIQHMQVNTRQERLKPGCVWITSKRISSGLSLKKLKVSVSSTVSNLSACQTCLGTNIVSKINSPPSLLPTNKAPVSFFVRVFSLERSLKASIIFEDIIIFIGWTSR